MPRQIAGCARGWAIYPASSSRTDDAIWRAAETGAWDVVTCMEVLEHCLEAERRADHRRAARLFAPGGPIVISVPIEIGPSLAGKQFFRALAGLRGSATTPSRALLAVEMLRGALGLPGRAWCFEGTARPGRFPTTGTRDSSGVTSQREAAERLIIESARSRRCRGPRGHEQPGVVRVPAACRRPDPAWEPAQPRRGYER